MIKKILEISLNRISAAFGLGGLSDYNTDKGLVIIYYCYKCIGFFLDERQISLITTDQRTPIRRSKTDYARTTTTTTIATTRTIKSDQQPPQPQPLEHKITKILPKKHNHNQHNNHNH